MTISPWAVAAAWLVLLLPGVARAADTPNPEGLATLRIEVVAAGRDTGEPPTHRQLEVVNIETLDQLATVSTQEMLDAQGAPCPGIVAEICSVDLTVTVRRLGTPLRVATDANTGGPVSAFSEDCGGGASITGDTFGSLLLANGETKTCRVTFIRPHEAVGTRPRTALLVRKTFDFDTRGAGFPDGFVTLEALNGQVASASVSNFYDLSHRAQACPLTGAPPHCEWAVIFDGDEWETPLRLLEATPPDWLPIFGGDCGRGGQLPLEAAPGDLVECTIYNVGLEDELTPTRNAVIRIEVVAPGETGPSDPLPIGVQLVGSASSRTVYAVVQLDGAPCDGLGPVACFSDIGVEVDPSRGSVTDLFWLTVPPGLTVGVSGDCAGGTTDGGVAAEVEMRIGDLKTCRLTVTLPPPVVQIGDASVVEGNSGLTTLSLPVTLSRPRSTTVRVSYATANGTATAPADYTSASGTLTFPPGQTLATISLSVVGDTLGEPDETFFVNVSSPVGATIADAQAKGTIVNDDDRTPPVIAAKTDVIAESKAVPVAVLYTSPSARDNLDGTVAVSCLSKSGSPFPFGTTQITCSAVDRNGNAAASTFNVVVRTPTTTGAVTNPGNDTPLTTVAPGRRVRVSAGGFAPGSPVSLLWIGPGGEMFDVGTTTAGANGRVDARVKVPESAPLGTGQMTALGLDVSGGGFVRAWRLEVGAE